MLMVAHEKAGAGSWEMRSWAGERLRVAPFEALAGMVGLAAIEEYALFHSARYIDQGVWAVGVQSQTWLKAWSQQRELKVLHSWQKLSLVMLAAGAG
jgi:hypothetical protein